MLEIDKLRLTPGQIGQILDCTPKEVDELDHAIADAALAKALWGVQGWLQEVLGDEHFPYIELEDALEAAGIQRPEGE